MNASKQGFTAVEILLVTLIVGLLAAMGSYTYLETMHDSRIKVVESELQMLATASLQLVWDTGKWPDGNWRNEAPEVKNELNTLAGSALFSISDEDEYPDWKGPYYEGSLEDPWGNPYFFDADYRIDGVMRVVVGSHGPNASAINSYDGDNIYVLLDD